MYVGRAARQIIFRHGVLQCYAAKHTNSFVFQPKSDSEVHSDCYSSSPDVDIFGSTITY